MQELIKSASRLSLAMPFFGAQQLLNCVRRGSSGRLGGDAAMGMETVAQAAIQRCGETAQRTFDSTSQIQNRALDVAMLFVNPLTLINQQDQNCGIREIFQRTALQIQDIGSTACRRRPQQSESTGWGPMPSVRT